ncbi:MAG TPA: ATP synthase F0 subunit B [Bryobacteraceae bacterium]
MTFWSLINFAMFVGLLGWGLAKFAPSFFNARSADIQKAIKDATGLKIEADFRYSEIDRQMANLPAEVERLKAEARSNMQRVHEHLLQETQEEEQHIRSHTAAEIEALRGEGIEQVRRMASQRAFGLAEKRLMERFAASDSGDMLRDFAALVERGKN